MLVLDPSSYIHQLSVLMSVHVHELNVHFNFVLINFIPTLVFSLLRLVSMLCNSSAVSEIKMMSSGNLK